MNKENIRLLADVIESERWKFTMNDDVVKHKCGSAGCIGGHAAMIWKNLRRGDFLDSMGFLSFFPDWDKVYEHLGLSTKDGRDLCFTIPDENREYHDLCKVTREGAVETLHHLSNTGEVRYLISMIVEEE